MALRKYFLYLKNDRKFATGSLRVAYRGIKFFYTRTCRRDWKTLASMKVQNVKSLPEELTRSLSSRQRYDSCDPTVYHSHVHFVVPGEGLSDGLSQWIGTPANLLFPES